MEIITWNIITNRLIKNCLDCMKKQNSIIVISSKTYEGKTTIQINGIMLVIQV